jgi:putative SOS response-associated peptidase YedK
MNPTLVRARFERIPAEMAAKRVVEQRRRSWRGPDGERELVAARLGHAGTAAVRRPEVTNIRDVKSPHRRRWLGPASRCIVPATPYCEYADTKPRKTPKWFALDANRPLFAVAGLRTL